MLRGNTSDLLWEMHECNGLFSFVLLTFINSSDTIGSAIANYNVIKASLEQGPSGVEFRDVISR